MSSFIPTVCSSICGDVEWVREHDCHRWGALQHENVGTWDVLCRVMFGRITGHCMSELLSQGCCSRCVLGVSCALTLTDGIQEKLCTECSRLCWAAAIWDAAGMKQVEAVGSLAAAGQGKTMKSMLCCLGKNGMTFWTSGKLWEASLSARKKLMLFTYKMDVEGDFR